MTGQRIDAEGKAGPGGPVRPECERFLTTLERRALGEEVPPRDDQLGRQHAEDCRECGALYEALGLLRDPDTQRQMDRPQARQRVLASVESRRRRRVLRRTAASTAAAAAALLILVLILHWRHAPPRPARPPGLSLEAGSILAGRAGEPLRPGERVVAGKPLRVRGGGAVITSPGFSRLYLLEGSTLEVRHAGKHGIDLNLGQGGLAASVHPGARRRLSIQTRHCRVLVKGTKFFVQVGGDDVRVDVVTGGVVVSSPRWPRGPAEVAAGSSITVRERRLFPLGVGRRRMILALLEGYRRVGDVRQPAASAPVAAPKPALRPAAAPKPRPPAAPKPAAASKPALRPVSAPKRAPRPVSAPKPKPVPGAAVAPRPAPSAPAKPTPRQLLESAQRCRLARRWPCAARAYETVIKLHPRSSAAVTSLLQLAEVELEYLDRPGASLRHFDRYLLTRPRGSLAQEALYGKARVLKKLRRVRAEKAVIEELLRRFPTSVYAAELRRRLERIKRVP